MYIRTYVA